MEIVKTYKRRKNCVRHAARHGWQYGSVKQLLEKEVVCGMKKVAVFIGVMLLVLVVGFIGIARYGEHGVRKVDISEGEISFDWLVEPNKERYIREIGGGLFSIEKKLGDDDYYDIINASGDVVQQTSYSISGGLMVGRKERKYFSSSDIVVIENLDNGWGLSTIDGKITFQPQKDYWISATLVPEIWRIRTRWGADKYTNFIDRYGNKIFKDDQPNLVAILSHDQFIYESGDRWSVVDRDFNNITGESYLNFHSIDSDLFSVPKETYPVNRKKNERENAFILRQRKSFLWGLFHMDGHQILPTEYSQIYPESEGLIGVLKNGKLGFVDRKGVLQIDFRKASPTPTPTPIPIFNEGLLVYWVNKTPIGQYEFDVTANAYLNKIKIFFDGIPELKLTHVIDKNGKTLFSVTGFPLSGMIDGVFLIYRGKREGYGIVTRSGDLYLLPENVNKQISESDVTLLHGRIIDISKSNRGYKWNEKRPGTEALLKFTLK